jgi:hypothetical protein
MERASTGGLRIASMAALLAAFILDGRHPCRVAAFASHLSLYRTRRRNRRVH